MHTDQYMTTGKKYLYIIGAIRSKCDGVYVSVLLWKFRVSISLLPGAAHTVRPIIDTKEIDVCCSDVFV